jgi:hypothetical protein
VVRLDLSRSVASNADSPWWLLLVLALAPDLSFVGFAVSGRVGTTAHTYVGPVALGAVGLVAEADLAVQIALIWIAHIGVDRALGYGLSFSDVGVGSGLIAFGVCSATAASTSRRSRAAPGRAVPSLRPAEPAAGGRALGTRSGTGRVARRSRSPCVPRD